MSLNIKENQSFKSFDVIAIVVLMVLGTFFYTYPFNTHTNSEYVRSSKDKAEILGYQLAQIYRDQLMDKAHSGQRSPASGTDKVELKKEGYIGADALGRPFKYQIIEEGPNSLKVILTNEHDDGQEEGKKPEKVNVELVVPINEST
ncbi:MAG: hypothetical protein KDD45_11670 [Bdellovibrionales bacterium]|nr:hypothetical protein [Bdellovibrionales bacterium]